MNGQETRQRDARWRARTWYHVDSIQQEHDREPQASATRRARLRIVKPPPAKRDPT